MFLVTLPDTLQGRGSLASRVRGWKDDATGLEQRLKDLETIARSLRRRWWLVGLGLPLGIIGWGFGAVRTRPGTMVLLGGGGLVLNALLGIINERGWYRWWLIYVLALLDVLLVGVLVVWFGHGGFVVAFLIAVLPYAFDQGHTVGNFLVLTAALAYLGASYLHGGRTRNRRIHHGGVGAEADPSDLDPAHPRSAGRDGRSGAGPARGARPRRGIRRTRLSREELQPHARGDRRDHIDGAA